MAYLQLPLDVDPDRVLADALDRVATRLPGWVPHEGQVEVALLEEVARLSVEVRQFAADVAAATLVRHGTTTLQIPKVAGASATATARFTLVDDAGHTVPKGTHVAVQTADGQVLFATTTQLTVPAGSNSGDVTVAAVDQGADANGLMPQPLTLVDAIAFVDQVATLDVTAGGQAPETDAAYLDRLTDELQLLAPRPILPGDFSALARRTAGVHRAVTLDGYDPTTQTYGNARMVTVVPVDGDGGTVPQPVADQLAADLDNRRELNFVIHVDEPTHTPIGVAYTITVAADADPSVVAVQVNDAVRRHLDPALWGGGHLSPPMWDPDADTVRYLEVAHRILDVDGVASLDQLTLDGGTVDVQLPGVAPLPASFDDPGSPSTITATVQ